MQRDVRAKTKRFDEMRPAIHQAEKHSRGRSKKFFLQLNYSKFQRKFHAKFLFFA